MTHIHDKYCHSMEDNQYTTIQTYIWEYTSGVNGTQRQQELKQHSSTEYHFPDILFVILYIVDRTWCSHIADKSQLLQCWPHFSDSTQSQINLSLQSVIHSTYQNTLQIQVHGIYIYVRVSMLGRTSCFWDISWYSIWTSCKSGL
jgi:hypothetical protein